MKRSELIFSAVLVPIDYLMLLIAGAAAYFIRVNFLGDWVPVMFRENLPLEKYLWITALVSAFWLLIFAVSGLYRLKTTRSLLEEVFQVIIASSAGMMGIIVYIFLKREWFDSRFLVLAAWVLAIICVIFGRIFVRFLQKYLIKKYQIGIHRVLIIGDDNVSQTIIGSISRHYSSGYKVVKHLKHPDVEEVKSSIGNPGIDEVVLADPNYPKSSVLELIDFCNDNHLVFKFVPNLFQSLTTNTKVDVFTGVPLIELERTSLDGWGKIVKRFVDILGSFFGLILLSPLFVVVGFVIKWETSGPVLVRLKRVSQDKIFDLYKFRSMIDNAEELKAYLLNLNERKDGPLFKMKNDPRVTGVGHFLRKTRLDELPQLINVLKGEISLVGPRPHQPDEIKSYEKHHKKVLAIKSGITGLAQISGSSDLPFEEEIKLDTYYVENWSFGMDVKILLKTLVVLFKDKSAC